MTIHKDLFGADLHISKLNTGTGSPIGVVAPAVIGEAYTDLSTGTTYVANGLTNLSWVIPIEYYGMALQSIINSNMEVAQQGISFVNPTNNAYTLDMWVNLFTNTGTLPTTITHTQNTLTAGELYNSKYCYQVNVNGAGSGFGVSDAYGQAQRIEFGTDKLCGNGKKVTISFQAKSSIASKRIAVGLKQVYGTGGSPSATEILSPTATTIRTLTSSMALYTFTFTTNTLAGKSFGTNNDDYLELTIYEMWGATFATNNFGGGTAETFVGSGNINFTQVVLNEGDSALLFQPKSFADELQASKRFFEKSCSYSYAAGSDGVFQNYGVLMVAANTTTLQNQAVEKFSVEKRAVPTIRIYGGDGATFGLNYVRDASVGGAISLGSAPTLFATLTTKFSAIVQGGTGAIALVAARAYAFDWTADARL